MSSFSVFADLIQLAFEFIAAEAVEGKRKERFTAFFDASERGSESGINFFFVPHHIGRIFQAPMSFHGWPEIDRARLACCLVAYGNDDIRRVIFEGFVALAAQAFDGNARLGQSRQTAR